MNLYQHINNLFYMVKSQNSCLYGQKIEGIILQETLLFGDTILVIL